MSYPQESFAHTALQPGSLLSKRRDAVATNTILYQLDVLKRTGRYDAFKLQWHPSYDDAPDVWPVPNHLFWDSDVAKWIEGACYFLRESKNSVIETAVHELVDMIRAAQQADGYVNIHFTVVEPGKRFSNLRDMHEMYNAGHLIEAALAHNDLYKNDLLLGPMVKYVDLLCSTFGPKEDQLHGYPGHPEIELALLRLYRRTQNSKHQELARYFIFERGNPHGAHGKHYYVAEAEARGDAPDRRPAYWPQVDCLWYYQAHRPIIEQESVEGHSVRAMYLLTACADLVLQQSAADNTALLHSLRTLWRNMVDRKMYLTGGIGAMKQWEGFGLDYFLPQSTDEGGCYSETCAAIGVMMLAERLLQVKLDGELGDIMELCLYNSVLTAMSHDGTAFTYVNQLASSDQDLSKREAWFTCACCPPNIMRLLGQIGGYATSHSVDEKAKSAHINVHLFVSSTLRFTAGDESVELQQSSHWPWSGDVTFNLKTSLDQIQLRIRIPGWAHGWKISPACPDGTVSDGYLTLSSKWLAANPSFTLAIPLMPRIITPHPYTNQNTISIARGPVVYCVEDYDNPWVKDHFKMIQLDSNCHVDERTVHDEDTDEDYVALTVKKGSSVVNMEELIASPSAASKSLDGVLKKAKVIDELHFVPYYFRSDRGGKGHMRVGLRRSMI